MSKIKDAILIFLLFFGTYLLEHTQFDVCLLDDVDFYYGKSKRKKRGKNLHGFKGFLIKFFYLDIKHLVKKWHYIAFWINAITFLPMIISLIGNAVYGIVYMRNAFFLFGTVHYVTSCIAQFAYWKLYRGNKIRSKKAYRKIYRSQKNKNE